MPDKKLTDNEIKKALECCHGQLEADCENCPNKNTCGEIDVIQQTLDLINRLQAENERLLDTRWNVTQVEKLQKATRLEAYKEFAQKLESIIMWSPKNHISLTAKDVKNILKGLVGE